MLLVVAQQRCGGAVQRVKQVSLLRARQLDRAPSDRTCASRKRFPSALFKGSACETGNDPGQGITEAHSTGNGPGSRAPSITPAHRDLLNTWSVAGANEKLMVNV